MPNTNSNPLPYCASSSGAALVDIVEILRNLGASDKEIRQAILAGVKKGLPGK